MAFQNLFRRLQTGAASQRQFDNWPSAPTVQLVPAGPVGRLKAFGSSPSQTPQPDKYGVALIVGLGQTGERVLRQWLVQLAQDLAGRQAGLRAVLITHAAVEPLPAGVIPIHYVTLTSQGKVPETSSTGYQPNRRQAVSQLFRQFEHFQPLWETLQTYLTDLRTSDLRAFLIGSLAEPEIGLLGDILQMLHLLQPQVKSSYASKTALLTLASPNPAIEGAELYAALREIGRFTFNGLHWMKPPAGISTEVVSGPLLDYLFLTEPVALSEDSDLRKIPFDQGIGQALSETLFTLLHPSARSLWERLHQDFQKGGESRQQTHQPVLHSLGIASLYTPLQEVEEYIAARLAYATVYGERPTPEGLLARSPIAADSSQNSAWLARSWLLGKPTPHPLYEWVLAANGPDYFRYLPRLAAEQFEAPFQAQLAHNLVRFLNEPGQTDTLSQARTVMLWLKSHFQQSINWLEAAPASSTQEFATLSFLLSRWYATVTHLLQQLDSWEECLLPQSQQRDDGPGQRGVVFEPATAGWRSRVAADSRATIPSRTNPAMRFLPDFLAQRQQAAANALAAVATGAVRRALTADQKQGLSEVESYYEDTVRPELLHYTNENSPAYERVRERLSWWVELVPGRQPQLLLICLPPATSGEGEGAPPPATARFTSNNILLFGQTLLELASLQARGLETDLTGSWLERRLSKLEIFLQQANRPLLVYDLDQAARYPYPPTRQTYLVGRHNVLINKHKVTIFPTLSASQVGDLDKGESNRFTALGLWLNIPVETVRNVGQFAERYGHQEHLHLYEQERVAARYETRLSFLVRGERPLFAPELTLALAHPSLVTLFCQALFAGLIDSQVNEGDYNPRWTILLDDERFDPLLLSVDNGLWTALWDSLRFFALELPHDTRLMERPSHPFHPANRTSYLRTLHATVQQLRRQSDYREKKTRFSEERLKRWQREEQPNLLLRSFLGLLLVEYDQPLINLTDMRFE